MESTTTTRLSLNQTSGQGFFRSGASPLRTDPARRSGSSQAVEVTLDPPNVWSRVTGRNALEITVQEGLAVVTFEGDREDHVLGPGETIRTSGSGRVALSAYRPSRFTVAAA